MTMTNGEPSERDRRFAKVVASGCPILIFLGLGLFGVSHYLGLGSDTHGFGLQGHALSC